jgi:hypothetical protein
MAWTGVLDPCPGLSLQRPGSPGSTGHQPANAPAPGPSPWPAFKAQAGNKQLSHHWGPQVCPAQGPGGWTGRGRKAVPKETLGVF